MNQSFWREIQKCWRIKTSKEDRQLIQETAASIAFDWGTTTIKKPYSKNPLDDLEDEDDEEVY